MLKRNETTFWLGTSLDERAVWQHLAHFHLCRVRFNFRRVFYIPVANRYHVQPANAVDYHRQFNPTDRSDCTVFIGNYHVSWMGNWLPSSARPRAERYNLNSVSQIVCQKSLKYQTYDAYFDPHKFFNTVAPRYNEVLRYRKNCSL